MRMSRHEHIRALVHVSEYHPTFMITIVFITGKVTGHTIFYY